MRASWVIVLFAACGGGGVKDIKDTPPPAPEATCRRAGEKLIDLVVAGQDPAPPDDAVNKLITLVEKRCEADQWKPEARTCFSNVKSVEDADVCSSKLSDQELSNLSNDMKPPADAPPPTGLPPAEDWTAPPNTRGPTPKEGADPCDGGE